MNQQSALRTEPLALTYLNHAEARIVEAIAERIIPGDGENAGARDAGVVYYIDRALSGFSANLQNVYRLGLRALSLFCEQRFAACFVDLAIEQQDHVVRLLLGPEVPEPKEHPRSSGPDHPAPLEERSGGEVDYELLYRLFAVLREHTVEGYFCDPIYGGNHNAVGWRLVGFPGAQWGYTAKQMKLGFDARTLPIKTLTDLRAELEEGELPSEARFYTAEGE